MSAETRVILCDACASEGRVLTSDGGPFDKDHGPCPCCNGTGMEEIEVEPITLDDLADRPITEYDVELAEACA